MTTGRCWSKADCAKALAMLAEGKSNIDVAEHFGVTRHAVNVKLHRLRYPEQRKMHETTRKAKALAEKQARPAKQHPWQRNGERWTDEENAELVLRKDRGENFFDIGLVLNRTNWSCKVQYHSLKRGTASKPGEIAATQRTTREAANELIHEIKAQPLRYASPFAEMLGEPPIGRSALDQKRMAAT
jgi:hypothetical protein